jgi:isoprenylcysteine carboxyl methyltransferase (ICMT) family protein YpbQ
MVYVETYIQYKELNIISGIGAVIYAVSIALFLSIGRSSELINEYAHKIKLPFIKSRSNNEYIIFKSIYILEIIGLTLLFQSFKSFLIISPFYVGLIIFRIFLVEKVFKD